MTITTTHNEIGYRNNVDLVEKALRENFGLGDNSYVLTAVASHIWSRICGTGEQKRWGTPDVKHAIDCVRARLADIETSLGQVSPEVAPLRLSGVVRQYTCGNTVLGADVALMAAEASAATEPIAVLSGTNAHDAATRILTAVNGRIPSLKMERVPTAAAP